MSSSKIEHDINSKRHIRPRQDEKTNEIIFLAKETKHQCREFEYYTR